MITAPRDPETGEDVLDWSREVNTLLRQLLPRESADIIPETGTTGMHWNLRKKLRVGGDSTAERWPFQGYRTSNSFDLRIRAGTVNDRIPSNNSATFTMPEVAITYLWVQGTFDEDGHLESALIDQGDSLPEDPEGSSGVAPATSSRGIIVVTTDGDGITDISPLRKNSLDVVPQIIAIDCQEVTLSYLWSRGEL